MPSIDLDVHRDFCEVAIFEDGKVTRRPRVPARRAALVAFARSLDPNGQVGLEATGNALAIARLNEPHVGRVVVANAAVTKGIGNARAKTDQLDARTLALSSKQKICEAVGKICCMGLRIRCSRRPNVFGARPDELLSQESAASSPICPSASSAEQPRGETAPPAAQ